MGTPHMIKRISKSQDLDYSGGLNASSICTALVTVWEVLSFTPSRILSLHIQVTQVHKTNWTGVSADTLDHQWPSKLPGTTCTISYYFDPLHGAD